MPENIKTPTEKKMNGINKTLKKAEKTKYKVTGRKTVVFKEIKVMFEDNGEDTMEYQAIKELENNFKFEEEERTTYQIESLEVIK